MYECTTIETRLETLETLYNQSMIQVDDELPILYSKIAIIELGGWIEETRDYFANKLFSKLFYSSDNTDLKKVIGTVSGFDYVYFRNNVFRKLIGEHGTSEIEHMLDTSTHDIFKANLGTLWKQRNACAHRSVEGTTLKIQAPSSTIAQFKHIKDGLIQIDNAIDMLNRSTIEYKSYS